MKRSQRWSLIFVLGLVVTGNASAVAQTAAAGSADTSLTITIQVHNYAEVDRKTLLEAEKIAAGIYRKVGVETRWTHAAPAPKINQENSTGQSSLNLTDIDLNIVPRVMADRLQLSNEIMGLAPGTGPDRHLVYIFYNRIERVNDAQPFIGGIHLPTSQTLGHAIAHEIGHLLLNMEVHSQTGIMRGNWGLEDLRAVACGRLVFTPQQTEVIRAEVVRRVGVRLVGQLQTVEVAGLESPTLAR
jgi:hypothetical protein